MQIHRKIYFVKNSPGLFLAIYLLYPAMSSILRQVKKHSFFAQYSTRWDFDPLLQIQNIYPKMSETISVKFTLT